MGTERDFVVKKGLKVAEDIELGHASDTTIARASAGQITVEGTAVVLAGGANHDGFSDFVGNEHIDHTGVTITAGAGLTGGGTIAATRTLTVGAGDGITVNADDVAITAAQTTITSVLNAGLVIGRDATDQIKFSTDDQIIFRVGNADGVIFKASGEIEATKFDGALEGNADTASVANRVVVVANDAAGSFVNENNLILFSPDGTSSNDGGNLTPESSTDFHYNPSTTILTVPKITSDFTGNVDGTATNATAITLGTHLINDVDIGTEFVDADDHIMSSGAIKEYVDANGGGASAIGGLSDGVTTATNNVGLGSEALDAITASQGENNVGLGIRAGSAITTGDNNTAIGYQSLQTVTTGGNNTGIGGYAGYQTTGGGGTFIGESAGRTLTSGYGNTAIGSESMFAGSSATAEYNTALGFRSLKVITTGTRNVAIGNNSLIASTTESDNIAIGYNSLGGAIAGGEYNLVIGNYAGDAITSADNCVLMGHEAGSENLTSSGMVAVGFNAGKNATGNNNTFIGYNAGKRATAGSSQANVAIGYTALQSNFGNQNTVIGNQAGINVTSSMNSIVGNNAARNLTSDYNCAFGSDALNAATSSEKNVAIGYGALDTLSTGDKNTALGYKSGDAMNTGSSNIMIGNESGDNITTGSNNVVIGKADVTATGSDQLSISSGDGSPVWITGNSSGVVSVPTELTVGTGTQPITAGVLTVINDDTDTSATLLLLDNESDATNGPVMALYRNSASPADNDVLGKINFNGEDSAGDARAYSSIRTVSTDVTNGTHDGVLHLNVAIGSTQTDVLAVDGTGGYGGLTHTPSGIKTLGNVVGATSTANNNYITLLAVPHANFKAIKASVHITDSSSNEVQTMDVMCHYDGSAANFTEYGIIYDGGAPIGEIEVDINSSNIRIRFKNTQGATRTLAGSIHAVCHP